MFQKERKLWLWISTLVTPIIISYLTRIVILKHGTPIISSFNPIEYIPNHNLIKVCTFWMGWFTILSINHMYLQNRVSYQNSNGNQKVPILLIYCLDSKKVYILIILVNIVKSTRLGMYTYTVKEIKKYHLELNISSYQLIPMDMFGISNVIWYNLIPL